MNKQLLIGAGIALAIAVVAAGVVVIQSAKDNIVIADETLNLESKDKTPQVPRSSRPVAPAPLPTIDIARPTMNPGQQSTGADEQAAVPAEGSELGEDERNVLRERMEAQLANMSDDERQALREVINRQEREARQARDAERRANWAETRRYGMASDFRLRMLQRNPDLRLSDTQQQQVETLREAMRPKTDAAMAQIWTQSEQLRQQMQTLSAQGMDTADTATQMRALREQEQEIRQKLDAEYKQSLSAVLSAEQLQALDNTPNFARGRGSRD